MRIAPYIQIKMAPKAPPSTPPVGDEACLTTVTADSGDSDVCRKLPKCDAEQQP